jgi:hypothetical protein
VRPAPGTLTARRPPPKLTPTHPVPSSQRAETSPWREDLRSLWRGESLMLPIPPKGAASPWSSRTRTARHRRAPRGAPAGAPPGADRWEGRVGEAGGSGRLVGSTLCPGQRQIEGRMFACCSRHAVVRRRGPRRERRLAHWPGASRAHRGNLRRQLAAGPPGVAVEGQSSFVQGREGILLLEDVIAF